MFQSTRPVRGATAGIIKGYELLFVSIHAPRAGRDKPRRQIQAGHVSFNPRAPCGARQVVGNLQSDSLRVSIHAPRAGRDRYFHGASAGTYCFNPRAPCGARQISRLMDAETWMFQSTRPVRGATACGTR